MPVSGIQYKDTVFVYILKWSPVITLHWDNILQEVSEFDFSY